MMPKFFSMIKNKEITKQQMVKDIIAGIIVAVIALPLSIALAISSGVSPEKGLITAIFAGFVISLLGVAKFRLGANSCICNYNLFYNTGTWSRWINNSSYNGWGYACYNGIIEVWNTNKIYT